MNIIDFLRKIIALIRGRKNKNLCLKCPEDIRGKCCYFSIVMFENGDPIQPGMKKMASMVDDEGNERKLYNIFIMNPGCNTLRECIKNYVLPKGCPYIKNNKKYNAGIPKVDFDSVKDELSEKAIEIYKLANDSPHGVIGHYIKRAIK